MKEFIVVDEMRKVVEQVSAILTPTLQSIDSNITGVHYDHGHPIEIIETLREKDGSNNFRFKKYPLVALFQDFPEDGSSDIGIASVVSLHVMIVMTTQPQYKASQRIEKNFKPVLYPIFQEFKKALYKSRAFQMKGPKLDCRKFDRLYWGREGLMKNETNLFNDWIDGIELRNIKLRVNEKLC